MRKIKEVLRLRFELGLGQREIDRACSISQGAVHSYLKKAAVLAVAGRLGRAARRTSTVRRPAPHRTILRTIPSRLRRSAPAVAAASSSHAAVGVGRIPAGASGRVRLQPLL
jgi:hypothetical protein